MSGTQAGTFGMKWREPISRVASAWCEVGSVEARVSLEADTNAPSSPATSYPKRKWTVTLHVSENFTTPDRMIVGKPLVGEGKTFYAATLSAVEKGRGEWISGPGGLVVKWVHALDAVENEIRISIREDEAPLPRCPHPDEWPESS